MGAFEFVAIDKAGKESRGLLEGDTPKHVRQLLRERALLPVKVTEVARKESKKSKSFSLRRGISASELALLTRQLATLTQSGLPLEEALLAVSQQNENPRVKSILLGVRSRVMEGHTLADGFGDFPNAFPELYRATVSAGEQSGHLDAVLERLAEFTESRQILQQQVRNAMIYPIALVVTAIGIISFMLAYVVPKVVYVFESYNQQLPLLTRIMIGSSDFLRDHWLMLIIGIGVLIFGLRKLLEREGPKRRYHHLLLKLPVVSRLTRGINTARFTQTLSILAGSGVPILESLRIAAQVVANVPMREAVEEASLRIREGAMISKSLAASRLFPPMTTHLISSGEAGGRLEEMLGRAAANQEREVDSLIATLLGIMQPLLVIVMAAVVLLIVLAILLPIFEINNLIG
ncbi:MAG: type II secretion system inner membrane protein GspF [Woeseia sp.]|nr:type II secretion system inner membrane protein GspF [Woeseia sp.]MBT8095905.1 type II secretion system inner membrane protein GspF [Woeseia sp.]NNE59462.1 type II secretion system inner membrane protein GspF [Woeseia sp.]NNL54632.1 type II secretion system inner membrane protein GspF [Woeseia sp.]